MVEISSSKGVIDYLVSDDPNAKIIRDNIIFKISKYSFILLYNNVYMHFCACYYLPFSTNAES